MGGGAGGREGEGGKHAQDRTRPPAGLALRPAAAYHLCARAVEAPERFQAIQSYRAAMAILRQQAVFVDELFASGIVNDPERLAMQARTTSGAVSGDCAHFSGHAAHVVRCAEAEKRCAG